MRDAVRLRSASLRVRLIVATSLAVIVVVAGGGVLIVVGMESELIDSVDEVSAERARGVAALYAAGDLPRRLTPEVDEEVAVQVVAEGRVVSVTPSLNGAPVLEAPGPATDETLVFEVDDVPWLDEQGPFRVTTLAAASPEGTATVFVVISLEDVEETVEAAGRAGAIGLSVLVVALCGIMWVVIGRTLLPVEAIRRRADAITGRNLARRVPEPVHNDEIGRLARTVNAMLDRLETSAQRQRRFVADAAHELRSPIASLRAQLEIAVERSRSNGAATFANGLMDETLRMQTLVDQLLVLARSDAGSLRPNGHAVDLDDTVHNAATATLGQARARIDLAAVQPVQVVGEADLLDQVVRNLLDNAVRHADREVHVSLSEDGQRALLTVDDDGPGIPESDREVVFRRFARLEHSRDRDHGGVGLGLAIVADIVEAHCGWIEITTSPPGGARFSVGLPKDALTDLAADSNRTSPEVR